ncbi:TonB-dependent receptor [Comamonas sp. JUb58]|uniref:TonB-dependent receptor n=1 Tax=Comamonas sp. JUb58 TaxID=2485114 RepID=UPI00105F24B6|nr:TonB-dependent receptor [Comamonas sp. JUb58]TDS78167.1 iron complex outermembrane receptor protein [Comamonas sp. JUb58]
MFTTTPRGTVRAPVLPLSRSCVAMAALLAATAPAWAQAPEAQDPSGAAAELPTVTVTARKREESLQNVPISMSVLDGQDSREAASPSDGNAGLARAAPNVSFADSGGQFGNLFVIRGVGSFAPLSSDDTSVVMYLNEVPRSVYGAPPALLDIDRVEVLRGPQGTLFGRNTQGGAINVIPHGPSFKREFSATTEVGSQGHRLAEVVANGALSDTVAGRLALRYSHLDGQVPNVATGGQDGRTQVGAARGSLLWLPGERTTVHFSGFYDHRASNAPRFIWRENPAFPQSAANPNSDIRWRDAGASLKVEHEFDRARLTALTSYQDDRSFQPMDLSDSLLYAAMTGQPRSRFDVPYADYVDIRFRERTLQQELRLSSLEEGPLTWTGGINLFHSRFINNTWAVASPAAFNFQAQNGAQDNRIRTTSMAAFGEGTLALSEQLKATLGLRYTLERKHADYAFSGNGNAAVVEHSLHAQQLSDRFLTGRAGLSYAWTPQAMAYASISRGAVGAGFPVTQTNGYAGKAEVPYETSTSWTYELGFKTLWLDKRLGLNGSLFYNNVKNGHLIVFNPAQALFSTASLNYRSQGAELEAIASLNSNLKLSAGLGFTQAGLVDVPEGSSTGAKSGNRVPNMPRLNGSLGLEYQAPMQIAGASGRLKSHLGWQYVGKRAVDVKQSFDLPGYGVVNARIGWQQGDWELYAFAWNLLDKRYLVGGQAWTAGVSSVRVSQPRIVGLGATVRF